MTTHSEAEPFLTPVPNDPRSPLMMTAGDSRNISETEPSTGGVAVSGRRKRLPKCRMASENILLILTVCGCVGGIILGVSLRSVDKQYSKRELSYIRFPGDIFIRMLKMCILPLIVSSIVSSLASLDSGTAGRMGMCALIYYFSTTFFAVIIGIVLVTAIQPGNYGEQQKADGDTGNKCISNAVDTILDLIRNLFPDNLVEATFENLKTCMTFKENSSGLFLPSDVVLKLNQANRSMLEEIPRTQINKGMNILGLVMFSVIFGIIISRMGNDGVPLQRFFHSLEGAMMRLISLVIWYSPVGITFLIGAQIIDMGDPAKELKRLMGYMLTVLLGLGIHAFIVLPALLLILARRNPLKYVYGMLQALLTALGTSSSSATLPLSIKCVEENNHVDSRVARFVLPLGATINMDGTALYEAVAAIYIAQTQQQNLSVGGVILVSLTATLASIGAAGIPQAGIVTMIMVLIAIGLPTELFVLIMPVDWFLDRIRTTVNVHGDSIGAAVVAKLCERQLEAEAESNGQPMTDLSPDFRRDSAQHHNVSKKTNLDQPMESNDKRSSLE